VRSSLSQLSFWLDALSVITPITRIQGFAIPRARRFYDDQLFFAGFQTWHRDHSFVSTKKFPELTSTRA